MKVCLFGSYVKDSYGIPSGNGGELIKKILLKQHVKVTECHHPLEKPYKLPVAYLKLLIQHSGTDYDVMAVPWRGILTLPLAKLIHKGPIISFPAFSIYDTLVNDRKKASKNFLLARLARIADTLLCRWSDVIILESSAEIEYFVREFGGDKARFFQVPLAADEELFVPKPIRDRNKDSSFEVLFFGSFIPLHGVDTIIDAAKKIQDYNVTIKICGDGQTRPKIEQMIQDYSLKNVRCLGLVSKEDLLNLIASSDCCLGIFGNTIKAQKVVTNKAFQVLASQRPLITMDSGASKEAHLESEKNCILVPPSDPEKLAKAILYLRDNPQKCRSIAEAGYNTYREYLSMDAVGKRLIKIIEKITGEKG